MDRDRQPHRDETAASYDRAVASSSISTMQPRVTAANSSFPARLEALRRKHGRKPSLLARIERAGLIGLERRERATLRDVETCVPRISEGTSARRLSMKDRREQIEELEAELRTRGASFYIQEESGEEMRESFLRHVLAFDEEPETTIRAQLSAHGHDVPHDLWTLIGYFAELNVVIERTDHLDDTALCDFLRGCLDEPVHLPTDTQTIMHIDLVGSGSDEDNALFFRYYASDQERELWTRGFPDETLEPRERPPHDRDRFLPTAEELRGEPFIERKLLTGA